MAALKNIKIKIQSVKKTGKVTRAMEAVSAVKMRKGQLRALATRPYAVTALSILARVAGSDALGKHPLGQPRDGKTALIVVTSDKGLAGALNSNVLRLVEQTLRNEQLNKTNTVVLCIGRRGAEYFTNRGYDVRVREENVSDDVTEADLNHLTRVLMELHADGTIGSAKGIYTNFISTFEQVAVVRNILPLALADIQVTVSGIAPAKGKYTDMPKVEDMKAPHTYTIEPSPHEVLDAVLPKLLTVMLFHALMEAKASEHSARMVAMKNATDKSKEVAKTLTLAYNKARQAAITREVSEITSGIEAMK